MTATIGHSALLLALVLAGWGMAAPILWARTGRSSASGLGAGSTPRHEARSTLASGATPTHDLIDRAGRIVGRVRGERDWDTDEARRLVEFLLASGD